MQLLENLISTHREMPQKEAQSVTEKCCSLMFKGKYYWAINEIKKLKDMEIQSQFLVDISRLVGEKGNIAQQYRIAQSIPMPGYRAQAIYYYLELLYSKGKAELAEKKLKIIKKRKLYLSSHGLNTALSRCSEAYLHNKNISKALRVAEEVDNAIIRIYLKLNVAEIYIAEGNYKNAVDIITKNEDPDEFSLYWINRINFCQSSRNVPN